MWRSHALVIESARQRRPGLRPVVVSRSSDQLALHLAGISFWSGAYRQAGRWGLRAMRSGLALQALPYVVRSVSGQLLGSRRPTPRIIGPGVRFSSWDIPRALIPYDRIYQKRLAEVTDAAPTTR
jgi:hypothetical protein